MRLREDLKRQLPCDRHSHFIVALSGGADSLLLAYFLIWLRRRDQVQVSFAHFCHHLRPAVDAQESHFLQTFAHTWQVPYYEAEADVQALACERRRGVEEAARFARFAFFERLDRELSCPEVHTYLALGHNLDDLVETILINLGKGTGISGLSSMPYFDGKKVRPLLSLRSQAIRSFMQSRGLAYLEDASNQHAEYLRNRLRLELIPLWEDVLGYFPGQACLALSENLQSEDLVLDDLARLALEELLLADGSLQLNGLAKWPQGLYYRILNRYVKRQVEQRGRAWDFLPRRLYQQIETKLLQLPCRAEFFLPGGWRIEINHWRMQVLPPDLL